MNGLISDEGSRRHRNSPVNTALKKLNVNAVPFVPGVGPGAADPGKDHCNDLIFKNGNDLMRMAEFGSKDEDAGLSREDADVPWKCEKCPVASQLPPPSPEHIQTSGQVTSGSMTASVTRNLDASQCHTQDTNQDTTPQYIKNTAWDTTVDTAMHKTQVNSSAQTQNKFSHQTEHTSLNECNGNPFLVDTSPPLNQDTLSAQINGMSISEPVELFEFTQECGSLTDSKLHEQVWHELSSSPPPPLPLPPSFSSKPSDEGGQVDVLDSPPPPLPLPPLSCGSSVLATSDITPSSPSSVLSLSSQSLSTAISSPPEGQVDPRPSGGQVGARPSGGQVDPRPSGGQVGARPSGGQVDARPSGGQVGARPSGGQVDARPSGKPVDAQESGRQAAVCSNSNGTVGSATNSQTMPTVGMAPNVGGAWGTKRIKSWASIFKQPSRLPTESNIAPQSNLTNPGVTAAKVCAPPCSRPTNQLLGEPLQAKSNGTLELKDDAKGSSNNLGNLGNGLAHCNPQLKSLGGKWCVCLCSVCPNCSSVALHLQWAWSHGQVV